MTTISAVITTFRRHQTLRRAIDSVLAQQSLPNELLIIDNANDGETKRVVLEYKKLAKIPVRYFFETKRGVSAARNRGLKESVCDYVAFLDDDDVWLPHHLGDFLTISGGCDDMALFGGFIGRLGNPELLIMPGSDSLFADYLRRKNSEISVRIKGPLDRPFYTPSMSQSVVEIERARNILFDEELPGREDIHFVWRMGGVGSIVLHHKVHGFADQLEVSLFSVMNNAHSCDKLRMELKKVYCGISMLDKIVKEYPHSRVLKNARAAAYFDSAYVNAMAGNTCVAFNHFLCSVKSGVEKKHLRLLLRLGLSLLKNKVSR